MRFVRMTGWFQSATQQISLTVFLTLQLDASVTIQTCTEGAPVPSYTSIMLDIIWATRRFGSWLYFCLQVDICCYFYSTPTLAKIMTATTNVSVY
jgi:hypothetical protein